MRTLAAFGIAIVLACTASQASANSSVALVYLGGSSSSAAAGGTGVTGNVSDTLTFDVIVTADAAGLDGLFFDLTWESTALTNASANWATGSAITSFAPFSSTTLTTPVLSGNTWSNIGYLGGYPTSTQVFLGTVTFHVQSTAPAAIATGFFATDGVGAVNSAGMFITPNFATFTVNPVPEPGLAALMAFGLTGLALAGRQTKN